LGLYKCLDRAVAPALPTASRRFVVVVFATGPLCHHFWWYSEYRVLHDVLPFLPVWIFCLNETGVQSTRWTSFITSRTTSPKLVSVNRWLALLLSDRVRLLSVDLENCLPYRPYGNVKPPDEAYSVNTGLQAVPLSTLTSGAHFRLTYLDLQQLCRQRELIPWNEVLLEKLIAWSQRWSRNPRLLFLTLLLLLLLLLLFVFSLSMWMAFSNTLFVSDTQCDRSLPLMFLFLSFSFLPLLLN
jgi:hypothetical protein